jgi:type II secretory pathway component PulC
MTGEGWSKMMYIMSDHYNYVLVAGFFTFLILFGVFFVLNLFLAVISDSFSKVNQAEDNDEHKKEEDKEKIATLFKLNAS